MRIVLLCALLTASLFGQHRGGYSSPGRGMRPSYPVRSYAPRPAAVVAYPVYLGGGYYGYAYVDQTPTVLVNPDFQADGGTQTVIDYSNVPTTTEPDTTELKDDQPTVFLIALTDHTVLAAIAYWVDGDTLHWVSRDAKVNQLSLSLVDRQFSKQLNDERHVEFKLPAAN